MSDARNKYGVAVGQTWKVNDERLEQRHFTILSVDLDYYPGGRAECRLTGAATKAGQHTTFFARLARFNGNKRGYTLVSGGQGGSGGVAIGSKGIKKAGKKPGAGG